MDSDGTPESGPHGSDASARVGRELRRCASCRLLIECEPGITTCVVCGALTTGVPPSVLTPAAARVEPAPPELVEHEPTRRVRVLLPLR